MPRCHPSKDIRQHARHEQRLRQHRPQQPGRAHNREQREQHHGDADAAAEAEREWRDRAHDGAGVALRLRCAASAGGDDEEGLCDRRHAVHAERVPVVCTRVNSDFRA